jgi:hypothetical protein
LPDQAPLFVYKHDKIRTNADRGYGQTPVVIGTKKSCGKTMLEVFGDVFISGQIHTHESNHCGNHVHAEHGDKNKQKHIKDKYIHALEPQMTDGQLCNATFYHVNPKDFTGVLYVNPIKGPIVVVFGDEHGCVDFKQNYTMTIKDVSLNHSEGCSYNVYITSLKDSHLYVEHYTHDCRLKVSKNGVYVLNSANGSVTFTYNKGTNGCHNTFNIINQFIGNPRVLPGHGLTFQMAHANQVQKMLKI